MKGEVKTRLAADVGEDLALEIYRQLVLHTRQITKDLGVDKVVYYGNKMPEVDIWLEANYRREMQVGVDLGERMCAAFAKGFEEGESKIIIIGSDCIEITTQIIEQAFADLDNYDCVFGPAKDGGYYLLGMKRLHAFFFQNKKWSTDDVLQSSLDDCESYGLTYHLLPRLNDIDTFTDLQQSFMWEEWKNTVELRYK